MDLPLDGHHILTSQLYADDLDILGHTLADLKVEMKALEIYSQRNEPTVNSTKTKIMVFRKGERVSQEVNNLKLNGGLVEVVGRYIYLGVLISSSRNG
uniref:Reverse transcriptase domain-containing protein n=1 Tax=Bracon brevicornis TaxID=1563983 RepID=A0A6V7J601_9HYME